MTSRPKPAAKRTTITEQVRRHPVLSWGTAAALVAIIGAGASASIWVAERFQTASDARAHADKDALRAAWATYGVADLKSLVLRNRVNECRAKKAINTFEATVCRQYEEEFNDASARARELYKAAMAGGKE